MRGGRSRSRSRSRSRLHYLSRIACFVILKNKLLLMPSAPAPAPAPALPPALPPVVLSSNFPQFPKRPLEFSKAQSGIMSSELNISGTDAHPNGKGELRPDLYRAIFSFSKE